MWLAQCAQLPRPGNRVGRNLRTEQDYQQDQSRQAWPRCKRHHFVAAQRPLRMHDEIGDRCDRQGNACEPDQGFHTTPGRRSEEHTSELQSLMRISYAVFCLKKKKITTNIQLLLL